MDHISVDNYFYNRYIDTCKYIFNFCAVGSNGDRQASGFFATVGYRNKVAIENWQSEIRLTQSVIGDPQSTTNPHLKYAKGT